MDRRRLARACVQNAHDCDVLRTLIEAPDRCPQKTAKRPPSQRTARGTTHLKATITRPGGQSLSQSLPSAVHALVDLPQPSFKVECQPGPHLPPLRLLLLCWPPRTRVARYGRLHDRHVPVRRESPVVHCAPPSRLVRLPTALDRASAVHVRRGHCSTMIVRRESAVHPADVRDRLLVAALALAPVRTTLSAVANRDAQLALTGHHGRDVASDLQCDLFRWSTAPQELRIDLNPGSTSHDSSV